MLKSNFSFLLFIMSTDQRSCFRFDLFLSLPRRDYRPANQSRKYRQQNPKNCILSFYVPKLPFHRHSRFPFGRHSTKITDRPRRQPQNIPRRETSRQRDDIFKWHYLGGHRSQNGKEKPKNDKINYKIEKTRVRAYLTAYRNPTSRRTGS